MRYHQGVRCDAKRGVESEASGECPEGCEGSYSCRCMRRCRLLSQVTVIVIVVVILVVVVVFLFVVVVVIEVVWSGCRCRHGCSWVEGLW